MSLKTFHLIFLAISIVFDVWFTWWAIRDYRIAREPQSFVLAVVSIAFTIALLLYGRWFLRKMRGVPCV